MFDFRRRPGLYALAALLILLTFASVQAQDTSACVAGFQPVTDAMGEKCVPENPQRIVTLEWTYTEDLLALGIQPVGMADIDGYSEWVKIPVALDASVADVGTRNEPNLEVIAGLNPDMIIGVAFRLTENYDELSAIAPTLVFNPYPDDLSVSQYDEMMSTFTTIGAAVNRADEGSQVLAHMEATYDAAEAALEAVGRSGEPFILSQGWTTDNLSTFRLFTDNAMGVHILEQIGLENAWDAAPQLYGFTEIGIEGFADLRDEAFNFFYVAQESDNALFAESPLWSSLTFVQQERAYWMGGDVWLFGGPLSAELLVDTVLTAMGIELPALETAQATIECEAGFRAVAHAMGTSCVVEDPQRVVVLDTGELDNALALGAPVIGAPTGDTLRYQAYLSGQLEGIADTGTISEPNFEAILALAPDLILGSKQRYEAIYDQLSQIAPTVLTESLRVPWQDNFLLHAEALNMNAKAEQVLAEYDAHIVEVQAALGDALDTTTVSVIRFRPGQVRLYLKSSYIGYILQDIGLQRPPAQDQDVFSSEISIEQMQDADADYIFVTGYDVEDSERDTFLNSPLWQTLGAVQNARVYDVNDDIWIAGLGVQGANLVLDDLVTIITGE
ncbi:MAG: iron-siderophore ABC transporter substrate-binding protein [Anaerolineae bacterium]|nr:iron-siderophore ABC transporter substrate-binding protein [Anaerolineae bacterium]